MTKKASEERMIILLEDNDNVVYTIINIAERLGYKILQTQDLTQVDYLLESKEKLARFDYLIIDLSIPCEYEGYFNEAELWEMENLSKRINLSGWLWLKRFIRKYPESREKIIILSAYINYLPEAEKSLHGDGIMFFDKARTETIPELDEVISCAKSERKRKS